MTDLAHYASLAVPGPTVTPVTQPFWDAVEHRELLLQHCAACRQFVFYPRRICPHCWSTELSWRRVSGRGALRTWSTIHRPGHPAWEPLSGYAVGLVGLAEGPTMLSHILAPPQALKLDAPLRVRFVRVGERRLPFFELDG